MYTEYKQASLLLSRWRRREHLHNVPSHAQRVSEQLGNNLDENIMIIHRSLTRFQFYNYLGWSCLVLWEKIVSMLTGMAHLPPQSVKKEKKQVAL